MAQRIDLLCLSNVKTTETVLERQHLNLFDECAVMSLDLLLPTKEPRGQKAENNYLRGSMKLGGLVYFVWIQLLCLH